MWHTSSVARRSSFAAVAGVSVVGILSLPGKWRIVEDGAGGGRLTMHRDLRASNIEREKTVEILQHAVGEGRITMAEFEERAAAAYAARTRAELDVLTADLPHSIW